ncbi:LysR family transcriptional regulator [Seongchinamella unica]|uniref:LysR family transcriptional regulator n=1 Tax=Seongchinamella unica TaxID=2547392 RepID=A0A4R5LUZ6_9GAMM|nr:LysR substrate-binding domain-containing protein [Seongchinamella unica]TDG15191.1 LysR family transcriptional regulator [Seongchinamella unica]
MRLPITLEALEVIDAIERKGSYAAAAAVLHKVPSAISYTVQKLEQDLGVTLFHKEGRRAVLSPAGRHLAEQGRELLYAADELAAQTRQVATGWEPRLRLAVDTVVPLSLVLPLVSELQEAHPGIEISLFTEVLAGTWEALLENRVDLVIGGIGDVPGHKGLHCEPWQTIKHLFVAAPDHPLCRATEPIDVAAVRQYRAVIIRDTSRNSRPLSRGILNQQTAMYVPTMEAKLEAHRLGMGVGYVPENLVAGDLAEGRLVALTLDEPPQESTAVLAWKHGNRGQALHFLLARLRRQAITSEPQQVSAP